MSPFSRSNSQIITKLVRQQIIKSITKILVTTFVAMLMELFALLYLFAKDSSNSLCLSGWVHL